MVVHEDNGAGRQDEARRHARTSRVERRAGSAVGGKEAGHRDSSTGRPMTEPASVATA